MMGGIAPQGRSRYMSWGADMSKAIPMKIGTTVFLVEIDEVPVELPDLSTVEEATDYDKVVALDTGIPSLDRVRDVIVESCRSLHEVITRIPKPEKIQIEFGVKVVGEAGIPMLTKASGEATIKVIVEWNQAA
jgi:hypothetical protein